MASDRQRAAGRLRVGVVDDHRLVLEGLQARLRSYEDELEVVIAATTWAELVGSPEFPVDVVVLDLYLGDHIPVETKVRALAAAGVRCVLMSRHAAPGAVSAAVRAGALGFVPKTASTDDLVAAIRAVAAGQRYLDDDLADTVEGFVPAVDPGLGPQEKRALMLYASGLSVPQVAVAMNTTDETVKSYIKRGRRKYRRVGIDLGSRVLLRRHAIREGWLSPEDE